MSLSVDYDELRSAMGFEAGWGSNPTSWNADQAHLCDMFVKDALRQVYTPPPLPNEREPHRWRFMTPQASLTTTAPYTTGTVTIASGVVTLTGGTWPADAADADLLVSGQTYEVSTRNSNTQLTLQDTSVTVASASSFHLGYSKYSLPAAFASFDGPMAHSPGETTLSREVEFTSPHRIHQKRHRNDTLGVPWLAAIQPKVFDATVGQRYEILFWPIPDSAYILTYRYKVNPDQLTPTNLYPLGGPELADLVKASCLAVVESRLTDQAGVRHQEYIQKLIAAVGADRRNAPDTLGYASDMSDGVEVDQHTRNRGYVTYNGIVPDG